MSRSVLGKILMSWPATTTSPLLPTEKTRLGELERIVEQGLATFLNVGRALLEIRDQRLYRESFGTFEAYLRQRWALSISRGSQLIAAVQTAETLLASGSLIITSLSDERSG